MALPKFSLQFAFSWSVYFSNRTESYSSQIEFAGPNGITENHATYLHCGGEARAKKRARPPATCRKASTERREQTQMWTQMWIACVLSKPVPRRLFYEDYNHDCSCKQNNAGCAISNISAAFSDFESFVIMSKLLQMLVITLILKCLLVWARYVNVPSHHHVQGIKEMGAGHRHKQLCRPWCLGLMAACVRTWHG